MAGAPEEAEREVLEVKERHLAFQAGQGKGKQPWEDGAVTEAPDPLQVNARGCVCDPRLIPALPLDFNPYSQRNRRCFS